EPLVAIAAMVLWGSFQPKLKAAPIKGAPRGREAARKNLAGRKPCDEIAILTAPLVRALDNLSGDRAEYQRRDRLSLARFLGLGLEDAVAGAKTLCLYRAALAKASAAEELFDLFLKDKGDLATGQGLWARRARRWRRWALYPRHEAGAVARCLQRAFI
ncbi:MAG TPA: transposase, partial [Methylocella sp.]|nr:transposase [Methylocella sp.]